LGLKSDISRIKSKIKKYIFETQIEVKIKRAIPEIVVAMATKVNSRLIRKIIRLASDDTSTGKFM
jgi:hypothetical protein